MKKCFACQKELGFLDSKHKCAFCRRTLCSSCAIKIDETTQFYYYYELMNLPHANTVCPDSYIFGLIKIDTYICANCYASSFLSIKHRLNRAINDNTNIELLPDSYRGRRRTQGEGVYIESDWHKDWNNCDEDLKVQAHYHGCDCVMNIRKIKKTETKECEKDNGKGYYTYRYSIWKKVGTAYPCRR